MTTCWVVVTPEKKGRKKERKKDAKVRMTWTLKQVSVRACSQMCDVHEGVKSCSSQHYFRHSISSDGACFTVPQEVCGRELLERHRVMSCAFPFAHLFNVFGRERLDEGSVLARVLAWGGLTCLVVGNAVFASLCHVWDRMRVAARMIVLLEM